MDPTVHIFPKDDGARVKVSFPNSAWVKDYQSMPSATKDAVNLGLIRDSEKNLLDLSQRRPDYPHDLKTKAQVELLTLENGGFYSE
jgi:hypothetical protein